VNLQELLTSPTNNRIGGVMGTLRITESRRLIYHFKNGMFATSVHCFVHRSFWIL